MKPISYINHKIKPSSMIDTNYLFIDGLSRSGKMSIAPVISSFNRVEHYKVSSINNKILSMYEAGNLNKQGFKYMFETELVQDIWFRMIGRDTNTNINDVSSLVNSPKYKEYLEREKRKDTPDTFTEIVNEIKDRQLIFPFLTEDFILHQTLLSEINKNFKYILVMRNPIDLVFTWFRSGRGTRLGTDTRYNKPAFQIGSFDNLYFSMLDNAEAYDNANPLEKCFLVIEKKMTRYMDIDLLNSSNSCLVPVENYWTETEKYIKRFENFLGTNRNESTTNEMKKANVPRKKDTETFSIKANMIFDNMNKEYVDRLKKLCQRYETEISDVYKSNLITNYPRGQFKGLSVEVFSKVSAGSKYYRGKHNSSK